MITYTSDLTAVRAEHLHGFFVGWPSPPTPESLLQVLRDSTHAVLARDGVRVVGFVNALSDGQLASYIPLLEVLPEHQGQGIGQELVRRMLELLQGLYMIDVMCDEDVVPFYEKTGMIARNYQAPVLHGA